MTVDFNDYFWVSKCYAVEFIGWVDRHHRSMLTYVCGVLFLGHSYGFSLSLEVKLPDLGEKSQQIKTVSN